MFGFKRAKSQPAINDTKTLELAKSAKGTRNIWDCQFVDKKQNSKWHNRHAKIEQKYVFLILTKVPSRA